MNCKRCGYKTNYKQNLQTHLRKVKECEAKLEEISRIDLLKELEVKVKGNEHKCSSCLKTYSNSQNLTRHELVCPKREESNKINELVVQMKEMNKELKELKENPSIINNNNTTNYNIVMNLNDYYHTNNGCVNLEKLLEILEETINESDNLYAKLIEEIHFNKKHPENWNILLDDVDSDCIEIYTNNTFEKRNLKQTMDTIIKSKRFYIRKKIMEWYKLNKNLSNEEELEKISKYILNIDFNGDIEKQTDIEKFNTVKEIKEVAYKNREKSESIKAQIIERNNVLLN
jgi:hypothetical protein